MLDLNSICQVKISLKGVRSPVWRRILVPCTVSLDNLHAIIQETMGWKSLHPHEFRAGSQRFGGPQLSFADAQVHDETERSLRDIVKEPNDAFDYIYDFSDRWEHEILLEEIVEADDDLAYPACIAGEGACPPEEVGGPPGYTLFLEAIADPDHPDHEHRAALGGVDFNPEAFDLDAVNARLQEAIITPAEAEAIAALTGAAGVDVQRDEHTDDNGNEPEVPVVISPVRDDMRLRKIQRLIDGLGLTDVDEINAAIEAKLDGADLDEVVPSTPEEEALQLAAEAEETFSNDEAIALAHDALKIDPNCVDAYRVLAEIEPDDIQRLEIIKKATHIAEERLGPEIFQEHMGKFSDLVEARPYMRIRHELAQELWAMHYRQEALDHGWDLLRLDEKDALGIRYYLINWLLAHRDLDGLERLLNHFPQRDDSCLWLYPKALYLFQREGASDRANQACRKAFESNPFVVELMAFPEEAESELVEKRSYDEAGVYVILGAPAWASTEGAYEWLAEQVKRIITQTLGPPGKAGRNDPCPCGSGKKYKRCCGATV